MSETPATGQSEVDVQWHFAIPVFSVILADFELHRQALIDLILENKERNPGIQRTNRNAWHSAEDLHQWQHNSIAWLCRTIGEFAGGCVKHHGKAPQDFELVLRSAWANVSGYGGWNGPHHHLPHNWSGVFYVQVEESRNPDDPEDQSGAIEFVNPIQIASCFGLPSGVGHHPKDGQMFLFHSALQHLVHPHFADCDRISIAFNLDIRLGTKGDGAEAPT